MRYCLAPKEACALGALVLESVSQTSEQAKMLAENLAKLSIALT